MRTYCITTLPVAAHNMVVALGKHWRISKRKYVLLRVVARDRDIGPDTPPTLVMLNSVRSDTRYVPQFNIDRMAMDLLGWEGVHIQHMMDHGSKSQGETLARLIVRAYVREGLHIDNSHA